MGNQIGFYLFQAFNLLLLAGGLAWSLYTLFALHRKGLPPIQQFIWAAIILFVPLLGPAAFWLAGPPTPSEKNP